MLCLRSTVLAAVATAALAQQIPLVPVKSKFTSSCPAGPASCQTSDEASCCLESPGGLIVQTQFWDSHPPTGPADSWTVHGLWPDNCDGTYIESCDRSRGYKDIAALLSSAGASSTLDFMNTYWVDINGRNEQFWEHEWSTHGTCYNTLLPSCFPDYRRGDEAVAFFQTVERMFDSLPTYQWLAGAGIVPDDEETHTLDELTSALKQAAGVAPQLECRGRYLNAVYWYFNLQGSVIDGAFDPIGVYYLRSSYGAAPLKPSCADAPLTGRRGGNCPRSGILYTPKNE
ncbi:base non-specific acid ribonuclease [Vararia minispora EC-137]|uniref:Base non-specific acid ribonuclease n=1 Tax=Vararia minispora EC-137 TaxID=1314806 RepID=A0ACB8QHB6_9AGAM|nr:base non-specific acid ribonuclease [Vararia minispora EC-137]